MKKNALLFFFLLILQPVLAQRAVPPLWGHHVHDEAGVLSTSAMENMEVMINAHEDSTSNQIAVLIIPSLDGEVIEEFALRVAHNEWKLGQKGKDNGVLLLIAVNDRKMRIEVGYGLEGVLPDAITSRIIRNEIAPFFRSQQYDEGVSSGVKAIINAIGGEYSAETENSFDSIDLPWPVRLAIGVFVFGILGVFTFIGVFMPGCGGWFLYAFLIPFYATFPMIVLGTSGGAIALGIYLIGFPLSRLFLRKTPWGEKMVKSLVSNKSGSGRGWSGGGFSSRGGGWSSSGGFSGGGGSFGGGGSSGGW